MEVFEKIYEFLTSKLENVKYNNGMSFLANCIYCGISKHNKPHLGVDILKNVFHCFRCNESGNLVKLLKDLDAPKSLIKAYILALNSEYNKNYTQTAFEFEASASSDSLQELIYTGKYVLKPFQSNKICFEYIRKRLFINSQTDLQKALFWPPGYVGCSEVYFKHLSEKRFSSFGVYTYKGSKIHFRIADFNIKAHTVIKVNKNLTQNDSVSVFLNPSIILNEDVLLDVCNIVICEGIFDCFTFALLNYNLQNIFNPFAYIITHGKNRGIADIIDLLGIFEEYYSNKSKDFIVSFSFLIDLDVKKREFLGFLKKMYSQIYSVYPNLNVHEVVNIYLPDRKKDLNELLIESSGDYKKVFSNIKKYSILAS